MVRFKAHLPMEEGRVQVDEGEGEIMRNEQAPMFTAKWH